MKRRTSSLLTTSAAYLYLIICCAVLLLPFMVTLVRSVSVAQPDGTVAFSLAPYREIYQHFWPKVNTSLQIALFTIVIDTIIGIPAAYALTRYEFRGKKSLFAILNGVWYVPGVCYAMALVLAYYFVYKFFLGFWGFVAAYSCGFLFLMLLTCMVAFRHFDPRYEEAALCLGAGRLRTFLHVTLPLIGPGVTAGILLTFVLSFNEFITALLLTGPTRLKTAPLAVYSDIRMFGVRETVAAEATVLQLISLIVVVLYLKFIGTRYLRGVILI